MHKHRQYRHLDYLDFIDRRFTILLEMQYVNNGAIEIPWEFSAWQASGGDGRCMANMEGKRNRGDYKNARKFKEVDQGHSESARARARMSSNHDRDDTEASRSMDCAKVRKP